MAEVMVCALTLLAESTGPRCAAWYQDYLDEHKLEGSGAVLKGGIKEWTKNYRDDPALTITIPDLS